MKVLGLLALLFVSSVYAEGYGEEAEVIPPAPPAEPYEEEAAPEEVLEETAVQMEALEELAPTPEEAYEEGPIADVPAPVEEIVEEPVVEEPAPPAPAPVEEELPLVDPIYEYEAEPIVEEEEPAPVVEEEIVEEEAPVEEEAAPVEEAAPEATADVPVDSYGPPPPIPEEVPEEVPVVEEVAPVEEVPEEPEAEMAGGYRRRRFSMKQIRAADIFLKFDPNCGDFHNFCKFWASIRKGTKHPLTGQVVQRSECFANRRLLKPDGCPLSCNICTNNRRDWAIRRRLAARKMAFLRRTRKIRV